MPNDFGLFHGNEICSGRVKERLSKLGLQSNIEKNHYVSEIEFHYWRQKNSRRTAERGNSALCS